MTCSQRTFQTRFTPSEESILNEYAELMSKVERSLFRDIQAKKEIKTLKQHYLKKFCITARQFNAARVSVEGKISSLKEIAKQRLQEIREKIKSTEKRVQQAIKQKARSHEIKQRLDRLKSKEKKLSHTLENGIFRICFGSKKLFHAQFNLEQAGYENHQAWKRAWSEKRNSSFFLLGSKDETGGNQTCTAWVESDDTLSLRLRLPDRLNRGKYLHIKGLQFAYGKQPIFDAIHENLARSELKKENDPCFKNRGQAICYRFCRDEKGWKVFITVQLSERPLISDEKLGYIGVDVNIDHLAVSETDRFGNLVTSFSVPIHLHGKSKNQSLAIIGDACKKVVSFAVSKRKPIVQEKLDFQKKKLELSRMAPKLSRLLSSFAYGRLLQNLKSRAFAEGIQVHEVNPAFTSLIGKIKFAKKYGLSIHHAAALTIARRNYKFSENLPRSSLVPDGKGGHIAFVVPVWNQQGSYWSYLGKVLKGLKAAFAKHFRVTKSQSLDPAMVPL